jgi:FkbM family methyltransferase
MKLKWNLSMNTKLKGFLRDLLPTRVKPHTILAGPLRGRTMVTSWRHNFTSLTGRTEPAVIAWFEQNVKAGETWLDIGANYGYTAMVLADCVGHDGRIYAFEPKLETAGCLAETVAANRLNQVTVIPMALSTCETLAFKSFTTSGSMAVGAERGLEGPLETLTIARLDWLWPRIAGDQKIDGVKIDVQGMELDVLRGMVRLLRAHTPKLIVEVHTGVDRRELLDLLESCGYERSGAAVLPEPGSAQPLYRDNFSYAFYRCAETDRLANARESTPMRQCS